MNHLELAGAVFTSTYLSRIWEILYFEWKYGLRRAAA